MCHNRAIARVYLVNSMNAEQHQQLSILGPTCFGRESAYMLLLSSPTIAVYYLQLCATYSCRQFDNLSRLRLRIDEHFGEICAARELA